MIARIKLILVVIKQYINAEGNFFITIFRLLAKNSVVVKDHLFSGHKYTSKMIQNEIRELY